KYQLPDFSCDVLPKTASRECNANSLEGLLEKVEMQKLTILLTVCLLGACLHAQTGPVKINSFPAGANVTVDGVASGKTTPANLALPFGQHTILVSAPGTGWTSETRSLNVPDANPREVNVTLLPTLTSGTPGPQGPQGPAGSTGPQGPKGDQGPQGVA